MMTPERDQQIMEVFLHSVELPGHRRDEYLQRACGDDQELFDEVQSLLNHHVSETFIGTKSDQTIESKTLRSRIKPRNVSGAKSLGMRRLVAVSIVVALGLALFWYFADQSVSSKLRTNVQAQLQSILNSDVASINHWMAKQMQMAENWAEHEDVETTLLEQARLSNEKKLTTRELEATPYHSQFLKTIGPLLKQPEVSFVGVFSRDGHAIAKCPNPPVEDVYWSAKGAGFIAPCLLGETVFIPSFVPGTNVVGTNVVGTNVVGTNVVGTNEVGSQRGSKLPEVSFVSPVRDQDGGIFAALQINLRVDEQFAALFASAHLGETGESFAFDERGTVLTNLRREEQLKRIGLIPVGGSAALNLQLRDPGIDLSDHQNADIQPAALPLCKVPADAIAIGESIDVDGYRNYLGADVVGAAKWLPRYHFGIAREMGYGEAYAPLESLRQMFRILLGLFVISVMLLAVISTRNLWLRREIADAQMLGQYELGECIGQGGMGQVFKASHAFLRRPAAIKLIRVQDADADSLRRFEREVQLTSELRHPNTIQIYDYGKNENGVFYFAMEYLTGMTLSDLVASEGPVSPCRTIHILRQVCASLREAHGKGVLHRDIKPANIMICDQGGEKDFVKVLDFGLVKQIKEPGDNEITRVRQLSGTPLCIAPERIRDPFLLDPRSDIYSMGIVGYFMLTGRYPFDGESTIDLLYRIVNGPEPKSLRIARPDIPALLDDLITGCLARDIENRPANMEAVVEVLDSLAVDLPLRRPEQNGDLEISLRDPAASHFQS